MLMQETCLVSGLVTHTVFQQLTVICADDGVPDAAIIPTPTMVEKAMLRTALRMRVIVILAMKRCPPSRRLYHLYPFR